MIDSILLSDVANYKNNSQVMDKLSKLNFIFGSNGSGKTTITRVIAHGKNRYLSCKICWKDQRSIQTLVYNRDFVEDNFSELTELKGVFTLGQEQAETLKNIDNFESNIDKLKNEINKLTKMLQGNDGASGKKGELDDLENQLVNKCWQQKRKYDHIFKNGFEGYRNSAKKFKEKVITEFETNESTLCDFEHLENRASLIFDKKLTTEEQVPAICLSSLIAHESNLILTKQIIGKEDVDIGKMIKKLGNSDWVRQGKKYFEDKNSICPFCQQYTNESFSKSLENYFDETFIADIHEIENLNNKYTNDSKNVQNKLKMILANPSKFLEVEKLTTVKELLDSHITTNQKLLEEKKKTSSRSIRLESLKPIANQIAKLIETANNKINEHNQIIGNKTNERHILTGQIWKFVVEQLDDYLKDYTKKRRDLEKAITNLESKIKKIKGEKDKKTNELQKLEKQKTSIQPTIDVINKLLRSFGFTNFSFSKASEVSYKLVRADGKDAKATLSEGEKNFVTFLYFYYLLKGSTSKNSMTTDCVVVIDDPISSLDADILFIVSTLIKELFKEMRSNKSHIKQIFILTHNVYFHKEVAFNLKRNKGQALRDETFWVIRKSDDGPKLELHESNPIKTSYELLWSEVRRPDHSRLTIQNTLRRIFESYFKILGGINIEEIYSKFNDSDRVICKSLFSWLNDGSHSVHDDLNVTHIDPEVIKKHLKIFKEIFEKSGHIAHYQMMMGEEPIQ